VKWGLVYGNSYENNIVQVIFLSNVVCRNNLKQLDEITVGLRRRLLVGHEAEQAQDSESAVPLSTSSALVTDIGSTVPNGTWELQSTLHGSDHAALHMLASTGGSASSGDAVTELMRQTLECTGSYGTDVKHPSHTVPDEHNHASGDAGDVSVRNSLRNCPANCTSNLFCDNEAEEHCLETRASTSVDRYTDSLKNAQLLLEQLNEMKLCSSQPNTVAGNHQIDSPIAVDFDEDSMQEDDTLANIWALRQSTRRDDDDESLDSTILPNERDKSYVSPQALNDVESNHDDFSAPGHTAGDLGGHGDAGSVELESVRKQPPTLGCSGESGDTWFVDTQDVRNIDMAALVMYQRLQDVDSEPLDADEADRVIQDPPVEVHSPGRPLSQSSPFSRAQSSPVGSTSYMAHKSRSLRRTAVQRREQVYREQYVGSSSDSESDDFVASMRLRRRRSQNSHCTPCDQPSASGCDSQAPANDGSSKVVDDEVKDVVCHNQEFQTVANEELQDDTEDEPQSAGSDLVAGRSTNRHSVARNDGVTVSDNQVLNGHRSASGEDLYPCE